MLAQPENADCKQFVQSAAVWTLALCRLVYRPTYGRFGELTASIVKVQLRRRQQVAVDPVVSRNQSASHPRRLESYVHSYIRDATNISVFNTLLVVTRSVCMNGEVGQKWMADIDTRLSCCRAAVVPPHDPDDGTMILRNSGNYCSNDKASYLTTIHQHCCEDRKTRVVETLFLKVRSNKTRCSLTQTAAADHNCTIRQGCHHFSAPDNPPSWWSQHINTFRLDVYINGVDRLWQLGVCKRVRPYSVQYVDYQHGYTCILVRLHLV